MHLPSAAVLAYGLKQAEPLQLAKRPSTIFQANVKAVIRITFNVGLRVHLLRSSRVACVQPAKKS